MADLGALLFPIWSFYAAPWLLGAGTSVAARVTGRPWHQALGIGIMMVPVWDTLWGILESFGPLLQGGQVLRPYTRHQLSGLYTYKFLADLGYLGFGFLLYACGGTWRGFWSQTPRTLARKLVEAGLPMGTKLDGRGEGASAFAGLLLFPVLLTLTVGANLVLGGIDALRQSDETSLFANMTPYHAITISLAAGFGEELVYRGLVQTGLSRRMPVYVAIVLQALFFGFAHSGYGTWIHVLMPTLFGLAAGLVAYWFGLWAAIALHVLVDVIAFGVEATANSPWVGPVLASFIGANFLLTIGWAIGLAVVLLMRHKGRDTPPTA
jgi:membrane protease YdiL (CAAX protease family)